jgi:hypothetical protein
MNMDDYDGPRVAVLVEVMDGVTAVDSAHPDEDEAAHYLGQLLLKGGTQYERASAWALVYVPAPLLARPLTGSSVVDLDAETRAAIRADAESVAREQDEAERHKMAVVLGLRSIPDEPIVPSWRTIRTQARRIKDLGGESFVAALRKVLGPALNDAGKVQDMTRPQLLDLVRSVVEATSIRPEVSTVVQDLRRALEPITGPNWSGVDGTLVTIVQGLVEASQNREPDAEGIDRALRAHWIAHRVSEAWDRAPEPDRERERLAVERIIRAYLGSEG